MPDIKSSHPATVLRPPSTEDAAQIWTLVNESGVLDRNSAYLYLLLCRDFIDTCVVAVQNGRVVGFVSGYRLPADTRTLFVWQVGVHAEARQRGVALNMLRWLVEASDESLQFIEATVSPSNGPSRRLFDSIARKLGATLVETLGFCEKDFPNGQHEAEPRIRIGPISRKAVG